MDKLTCGARLRSVRRSLKLTQKAFGEWIGINQASLSQYERGYTTPPLEVLVKVSKLAEVSIDWLCGLQDEHQKNPGTRTYMLYKIYYGDELVYVGRTAQPLKRRLYGHFSKAPMMRHLDARKVTKIEFASLETEADLYLYEIYYINLWKPSLNKDDKSKQPLTVELPPLEFREFECELLPKWKQMAQEKADEKHRRDQKKEKLRSMLREKRMELKMDPTLSEEQKAEKLWEWRESVYEPMMAQLDGKATTGEPGLQAETPLF